METVERHWNGRSGFDRRDVRVLFDGEVWVVEAMQGGAGGESMTFECGNEQAMRSTVQHCLDTGGEGWRKLPVSESE